MAELSKKEKQALYEEIAKCFWDPLRFAIMAFPWGKTPEFSLVKLQEPWKSRFPNCEFGPDAWTCRMFDEITAQVKRNNFDGKTAVEPIRVAVASGHGIGKGQEVSEVVDTPSGRKVWGNLKVGDYLFGPDGKPTRIIAIPYRGMRPSYRVTFDDGSSTIVSQEHLWTVRGRQERRRKLTTWRTLETREILRLGVKRPNGKAMARQWEIPRQAPIEYPENERVPVGPYLMGMAIGNGHVGKNGATGITISSPEVYMHLDGEIPIEEQRRIDFPERGYRYCELHLRDMCEAFRDSGIAGRLSDEKFIPQAYKESSVEQRSELFRGLIDSDGDVGKQGTLSYATTSPRLRDDVVWLARSLGGKAQVQPAVKHGWYYGKDGKKVHCKPCWRITLTMPRDFLCGYYKERVDRIKSTVEDRYLTRWIDSIEPVGEKEIMCVTVDRPDGLYLANDFIVTHNSFSTGLLLWWLMSTRPNCKGTVTATTMNQLSSKTWAQVAAMKRHCITGDWFTILTGKGNMVMYHNEYPDSWRLTAQACKEENSEAFAGQHAADSTSFYIFDEASGVPNKIWEVAEGGLTDGEPMIFVFGNPTKSSGAFYDCFHSDASRWTRFKIDSREAQLTNKKELANWAEKYGEDSDFFKVRVRGEFPNNASVQFIPTNSVEASMDREAPGLTANNLGRAIVGLDIARFGNDATVIATRVGRDARSVPMKELRKLDGRQVGQALASHCNWLLDTLRFREVRVYFDRAGIGASVWDYLRYEYNDLRVRYYPVDFGMKARNYAIYLNRRIEMWAAMRDWIIDGGCLPKSDALKTELISPEYAYNDRQQMFLERKADLKDRIGCSPDHADALALTFSEPNADLVPDESVVNTRRRHRRADDDPFNALSREMD